MELTKLEVSLCRWIEERLLGVEWTQLEPLLCNWVELAVQLTMLELSQHVQIEQEFWI